jgi:cation:H+ antiporter
MLNMVAVTWSEIFYTSAPILTEVSHTHAVTAILASIMSLIVILGLRFRQQRKTFIITSWYTPLFFGLYIFGSYYLFQSGIG